MLALWIIVGAIALLLAGAAVYDRSARRRGRTLRGGGAMSDEVRDSRMDAQAKDQGNHTDMTGWSL